MEKPPFFIFFQILHVFGTKVQSLIYSITSHFIKTLHLRNYAVPILSRIQMESRGLGIWNRERN